MIFSRKQSPEWLSWGPMTQTFDVGAKPNLMFQVNTGEAAIVLEHSDLFFQPLGFNQFFYAPGWLQAPRYSEKNML